MLTDLRTVTAKLWSCHQQTRSNCCYQALKTLDERYGDLDVSYRAERFERTGVVLSFRLAISRRWNRQRRLTS